MLPFVVSHALATFTHTIALKIGYATIINNLKNTIFLPSKSIENYLISIQQFKGKFDSICTCSHEPKELLKKIPDKSDNLASEQDYRFAAIKIPENIKKYLDTLTSLEKQDYLGSVLMTIFFTYVVNAFFYRSFTAPFNTQTIGRMALTIVYNCYVFHKQNQAYQNVLKGKVLDRYQDFVIKAHNAQLTSTSCQFSHVMENMLIYGMNVGYNIIAIVSDVAKKDTID